MSFYGCALWNLNNKALKCIDVSMNKVLCRVWHLPYNCHTDILHSVAGCYSISNVSYNRFCKLVWSAKSSPNSLVRSFFQGSLWSCRNYSGYNVKYGLGSVRDYNSVNHSIVGLIKEIRDPRLHVHDFDQFMLNEIVHIVSCLQLSFSQRS